MRSDAPVHTILYPPTDSIFPTTVRNLATEIFSAIAHYLYQRENLASEREKKIKTNNVGGRQAIASAVISHVIDTKTFYPTIIFPILKYSTRRNRKHSKIFSTLSYNCFLMLLFIRFSPYYSKYSIQYSASSLLLRLLYCKYFLN